QQTHQPNPMTMPQQSYQPNPMTMSQQSYEPGQMPMPQQMLQPQMPSMPGQQPAPDYGQMMSPFGQQAMPRLDEEPLFSDELQQTGALEAFNMPRYADESSGL
ncbi:hypothetical protein, partial [Bacillus sp. JJ722]|uniref:hypothetical protein n=1 Tax=Bacillus sp. JJ722 TaxID=3122973 RepID=UPI003B5F0C34